MSSSTCSRLLRTTGTMLNRSSHPLHRLHHTIRPRMRPVKHQPHHHRGRHIRLLRQHAEVVLPSCVGGMTRTTPPPPARAQAHTARRHPCAVCESNRVSVMSLRAASTMAMQQRHLSSNTLAMRGDMTRFTTRLSIGCEVRRRVYGIIWHMSINTSSSSSIDRHNTLRIYDIPFHPCPRIPQQQRLMRTTWHCSTANTHRTHCHHTQRQVINSLRPHHHRLQATHQQHQTHPISISAP